jgi:hypothetical protein
LHHTQLSTKLLFLFGEERIDTRWNPYVRQTRTLTANFRLGWFEACLGAFRLGSDLPAAAQDSKDELQQREFAILYSSRNLAPLMDDPLAVVVDPASLDTVRVGVRFLHIASAGELIIAGAVLSGINHSLDV